jgi:hypothetical protein
MQRGRAAEHQLSLRRHRDFRVAQIAARVGEPGGGNPVFGVRRRDDAQGAVRGNVRLSFAKHTEPPTLESDQVSKGIMRRVIPDFADFDQGGFAFGRFRRNS